MLGGSRRRLGGIGLGYLFLDASHFKYHVGASAKLVLAACRCWLRHMRVMARRQDVTWCSRPERPCRRWETSATAGQ